MKILLSCVAICAASLQAFDEPQMKEGLWSIHVQTIDNPGSKKTEGTRSICRSHAYDKHTEEVAKQMKTKCKVIQDSSASGKIVSETECTIGSTTLHTKGTSTVTGGTSSHSETVSTYTPPLGGISETTMIMDQKYVGACPAGTGPGDSISADGHVTHLWKP